MLEKSMTTKNILLIDDNTKEFGQMNHELGGILKPQGISISAWNPVKSNENPAQVIKKFLKSNPVMVVTNYDHSSDGINGYYGPTIVRWCKSKLIPVGEYSQRNELGYLEQPNLFDISVPSDRKIAPTHIASIVSGFISIKNFIETNKGLFKKKLSLSNIISLLLGREHLHLKFSPYIESIELASNNVLLFMNGTKNVSVQKLQVITAYLIGHLLLNAILKFPGPIISKQALCSYLSVASEYYTELEQIFSHALYQGPFNAIGPFYWREDVDQIILENSNDITGDFEGVGAFNRAVLQKLGVQVKPFKCNKCYGKYGGYYCPFTKKTVCELESCSVTSSTWIPRGFNICRIEKNYFESWRPLLYT